MRFLSLCLLFLSTFAAQAQSLFPLDTRNQWTYRERGGTDTFKIQVGTPVSTGFDDRIYYPLTGYVNQRVLARFASSNALLYYDNVREQENLLTTFEPARGIGWFFAPFRVSGDCEQNGQGQPERNEFQGPAGRFSESVTLLYRTIGCADVGVLNEVYAPGIGMVQRTVSSIRGPRIYDLVDARIGNMTLQADRGAYFRVALAEQPNVARLKAHLELVVVGGLPAMLHFPSSQDFDLAIRKLDGTLVWQWSTPRSFAAIVRDVSTTGLSWDVDIPMTDNAGVPFVPGTYLLEAWIASGYDRPQFASSVTVQVAQPKSEQ